MQSTDVMNIPLCKACVDEDEKQLINEVLDSGWYAHGPQCKAFEEAFAEFIGVKHAVSLNSCTAALHLAIQANNITGEVILPSFTFVASANAVITAGATPVFCDVDPLTCNIDVEDAARKISKKTQAIMPVHYAGLPCEMDAIQALAKQHNLLVIEDAAECIGGAINGKKAGSFGLGCFSFYPTKNMTTGEGGMLTLNDDAPLSVVKALKGHGILSSTFEREKKEMPWLRSASYAGFNFRLSDILAAMGLRQLKKLNWMNEQRRKHAQYLNQHLKHDAWAVPVEPEGYTHVYQMYTLRLDPAIHRTKLIADLRSAGIGASVHFDPPVHQQEYYRTHFSQQELPVTEKIANTIMTLPMYPQLSQEELDYMIDKLMFFIKQ